ncbi:ABC transporter permease [Calidifontibacter sp. DB0510]|uniref:Cell division protein FtsX n=1 Tax=Metallococcus carri TaxID=1656884 RepID=A0A967EAN3_9MICO|nr:permease-like cell division protein FtsX [Metallococcus carri]NHN56445.1 ABC transporter permease [Metallococcus carri]NOP36069.1 ABC transporter permease [Calidifontibacter sp. DB2511S]
MRLLFILGETWQGIRRNASMIVSVLLVSMISMFFLGSGLLAQREVNLAKGYWYDKVEVSVFLCTPDATNVPSCSEGAVTPAQQSQIRRDLVGMGPLVENLYYESSAQAYNRFKAQMQGSPYLSDVSPTSLPSSFRVKLSDPGRYADVVARMDGQPGVLAVSDQRQVLDTFFKLLGVLSVGAVGLAVLMTVCAVLLISTTVRQVAFSRRKQVEIMRLVGASAFVIYVPFVIEIVLATVVGAALATGLLWLLVHYGVSELFNGRGSNGDVIALIGTGDVWRVAPWLILGAAMLSLIVSWFSLRRQVRV